MAAGTAAVGALAVRSRNCAGSFLYPLERATLLEVALAVQLLDAPHLTRSTFNATFQAF
jgi:hypothetical protein